MRLLVTSSSYTDNRDFGSNPAGSLEANGYIHKDLKLLLANYFPNSFAALSI